jgi:alpha-N-arabinofuranosidase
MIQNRNMAGVDLVNNEPNRNLVKWHNLPGCNLEMDNSAPLLSLALPYQMSATVASGATGITGLWNEGYAGFNVTTATSYNSSFWLRGRFDGAMTASFISNTTGAVLSTNIFTVSQTVSQGWVQWSSAFTVSESAPDFANTWHLTWDAELTAGGTIYFNMLSISQQTFEDGPLRMDLANAVNDIGGKSLRLPSGNNLEGNVPPNQWVWNNTIGPIQDRPGRSGAWGYYNTDGLGLLEMMEVYKSITRNPRLSY